MKRLIISILACFPLWLFAQDNVWEIPDEPAQSEVKVVKKEKPAKQKKQENPKYLAGAVPEVNGKVVFTLDKDVPGMSAEDIYNKTYDVFRQVVEESKSSGLKPGSRIAAVNKSEHTIAARINEWLVFSNMFLSLDRTQFNFVIVAHATDGHINMTMERLSYAYEVGRDGKSGLKVKAEDWITDREALNKRKTKLLNGNGKFRRKTIDRKDNIFSRVCKALGISYQ